MKTHNVSVDQACDIFASALILMVKRPKTNLTPYEEATVA
jgi:hypothetical protein